MSQIVVFPDAAAVIVGHLRAALAARDDPAVIGTQVPHPRPGRLVRIRRTGGPRLNRVADRPQLSVECWAPTAEQAADLAQLCRGLIHAMRGTTVAGVAIYRVAELAGPAELPDPASDQPRYVQTFEIAMRGTAA